MKSANPRLSALATLLLLFAWTPVHGARPPFNLWIGAPNPDDMLGSTNESQYYRDLHDPAYMTRYGRYVRQLMRGAENPHIPVDAITALQNGTSTALKSGPSGFINSSLGQYIIEGPVAKRVPSIRDPSSLRESGLNVSKWN
ncbi:hypothetical protein BDK51DRAFT_26965 [Blyttiomyces helicus]|uniref:Uncharacterized protein n=1 Tax=Blyttiomyces helicus TaxID=388810 RepID=A0A4P9W5U7_9FUNG|nr:hypothetical protein BDK51DRAFT_26965 [Blyttiomyces helicus]|eukprot:RKO87801.1 hypothetical protein BDK51DRAFT_26965 [Blyttiomyces helicus]